MPQPEPRAAIPCGLYRTTRPLGDQVRAGLLVLYHNHGDPGPGLYLPRAWKNNRAIFETRGITIHDEHYAETLAPLLPEGFYRVRTPFSCCERECQRFEIDQLVQLGYDGDARAILFRPELFEGAIVLPATGTVVDDERLSRLQALKVSQATRPNGPTN